MSTASEATPSAETSPPRHALAWGVILGTGVIVWLVGVWRSPGWGPTPDWRLLAVFLPTVLALMLRPLPGGAAVLIGVIATVLLGALKLDDALQGYSSSTVWLVLAAYFMSRAFIKTGLARRIALSFIRLLGGTSLGLSYAMTATDTVLAGMIPSNAARVGGVVLPVTRGLVERFASLPREAAERTSSFLMVALYQADVLACSLFLTGQASNPLAASYAAEMTGGRVVLSYGSWFLYALAPALVTLLLAPYLVYRLCRAEQVDTAGVVSDARDELARMGPMSRQERTLAFLFVLIVLSWIVLGGKGAVLAVFTGPTVAAAVLGHLGSATSMVALLGVAALLLTRILSWDDVVTERAAWDVFLWYGGLVMMGEQLGKTTLLSDFAGAAAGGLSGWSWLPLFVVTLLVYFYAHYLFASITVHMVALYTAFVPVLIATGAPAPLVACAFAFFANFSAGLTHYGTTPGPIIYSLGYVTHHTWWRIGFLMSLVNVTLWLLVGLAWWKLLGLW